MVFKMKKGFTLIELLVVIVIIGILMGILLVSYQGTRVTARDGKRKADLEQIRSALQMYHSDCGEYPSSVTPGNSLIAQAPCTSGGTYMSQIPNDPLPTQYTYVYSRDAVSVHLYSLYAYLESESAGLATNPDCDMFDDQTHKCNYVVIQP